jgi:hypothetical protein
MPMSCHGAEPPAPPRVAEHALLASWQARSAAAGWPAGSEWRVPAVDACVRASYDLDQLLRACEQLAAARATHRIDYEQALADLDALWNEIATVDAPPDFVRAFTVAWSNASW